MRKTKRRLIYCFMFLLAISLMTVTVKGNGNTAFAETPAQKFFRLTSTSSRVYSLDELVSSSGAVKENVLSNATLEQVSGKLNGYTEAIEIFLGPGGTEALNIHDECMVLTAGTVYLKGTLTGAAKNMDSMIDFSGNYLQCDASLTNTATDAFAAVIKNTGTGTVSVNSGTISAGKGIALYSSGGKLVIKGNSTITSANVSSDYGTVFLKGGAELEVVSGSIVNSAVDIAARAVNTDASGNYKIKLKGGTIRLSNSKADGIALNNRGGGEVIMESGQVSAVTAKSIAINNAAGGTVDIRGGTVDGKKGVAVFNSGSGKVIISQPGNTETLITSEHEFTGTINSSSIGDSEVVISGGRVINAASRSTPSTHTGGIQNLFVKSKSYAIYTNTNSKVDITITGGTITLAEKPEEICEENAAIYYGSKGTLTIKDADVSVIRGYAIHSANNGNLVEIQSGTVKNTGGPAIFNECNGTVKITGGTVEGKGVCIKNDSANGHIILDKSLVLKGSIDIKENLTLELGEEFDIGDNKLTILFEDGYNGSCILTGGAKHTDKIKFTSNNGKFEAADEDLVFVIKITLSMPGDEPYQEVVYATADGRYPTLPDLSNFQVSGGKYVWAYGDVEVSEGDKLLSDVPHTLTAKFVKEEKGGCYGCQGGAEVIPVFAALGISALIFLKGLKKGGRIDEK